MSGNSSRLFVRLAACALVAFAALRSGEPRAASGYFREVCASGCTYTTIESALSSITDNDATKVYTIFVDAGVYSQSSTITWKSYVNLQGRGRGNTIIRASSSWFTGTSDAALIDMTGLTGVTFTHVTIDALTNDPGNLSINSAAWAALETTDGDALVFDSTELRAVTYALWETSNTASHRIDVRNSSLLGGYAGIGFVAGIWHVYGSEVKGVGNAPASMIEAGYGIYRNGGANAAKLHIWGSHIHGELAAVAAGKYAVNVHGLLLNVGSAGLELDVAGSTIHAKLGTTTTTAGVEVASIRFPSDSGGKLTANIEGSDLLYQTPTDLPVGLIGGLAHGLLDASSTINLVGVNIVDEGGSLASSCTSGAYCTRADVIGWPVGPGTSTPTTQATVRFVGTRARSFKKPGTRGLIADYGTHDNTINAQKGSATFASTSTVTVTLPVPLPDANYRVLVTPNTGEIIWVTGKSATGFTLNSSNSGSTAQVDWLVNR